MTMTDDTTGVLGQRLLRREDPALLTGEARFTSDLPIPGALHLAVLRSPYARARILSVDTSAAAAMPGVTAVFSGADLADAWAGPMPCAWPVTEDMKSPTHYPLAVGQANYVGDGVATAQLAGRTLAHLIADTGDPITRLPWVGHRSRRWEPEPIRWMGIRSGLRLAKWADRMEERTQRPS